MIEHNVVSVGGVEYKAVADTKDEGCTACAINKHLDKNIDCKESCLSLERQDNLTVIFKPHYRPKHNELPIKVIEL